MRIFINYRRSDAEWPAGRLYDRLTAEFDRASIFKDIDTIEPGEDFRKVVAQELETCDAFVAVIGPGWLSVIDDQGARRLDDVEDPVRQELEAALKRDDLVVIPVLVGDARMPGRRELPAELVEFADRNAQTLSTTRWDYDVGQLVERLNAIESARNVELKREAERERKRRADERAAAESQRPKPPSQPKTESASSAVADAKPSGYSASSREKNIARGVSLALGAVSFVAVLFWGGFWVALYVGLIVSFVAISSAAIYLRPRD